MRSWTLINIYFSKNSALEHILDSDVLKGAAFGSKEKSKNDGLVSYLYVAVPIIDDYPKIQGDLDRVFDFIRQKCPSFISANALRGAEDTQIASNSIYEFLKPAASFRFSFDVVRRISDRDVDVFYSDGSSNRKTGTAAYATCKLLSESMSPSDPIDRFTDRHMAYEAYSGKIDCGTNNIGELTGVKAAIEHAGDKDIQVIISDSEYSIKAFREWMYAWMGNKYRGANGKAVLNAGLIKAIIHDLQKSDKIWLFKWTKGHADDPFNEICDRLAKDQIGIK